MTDRPRVTEVLVGLPDGACFVCVSEKTGLDLERVIEAVDSMPPLDTYFGFAPCPFCGERRRIVSIYRAP